MTRETVDPGHFLRVCRTAVGCTDQQRSEGLRASPAELLERAFRALDGYVCGCIWCAMLGDRSDRGGPVVVSAHCAALFVERLLGPDVSQPLMRLAAETHP